MTIKLAIFCDKEGCDKAFHKGQHNTLLANAMENGWTAWKEGMKSKYKHFCPNHNTCKPPRRRQIKVGGVTAWIEQKYTKLSYKDVI